MCLFFLGRLECSSPPLLKRQDLDTDTEMETEMEKEMEMEKVDASRTTVGTEGRTETSGREAAGTEQEKTIAFGRSQDISAASEVRPDDVAAAPCWLQHAKSGVEDTESDSQCPVLERSVCPSSDTVPPLTCNPDTKGDNQRAVAATLDDQTSLAAKHPGKVIMTDVTINSLTVTFLEATVAEGFFKGH